MILRILNAFLPQRAPALTGAVFCLAIAGILASCDRNQNTPDWDTPAATQPAARTTEAPQPDPAPPAPEHATADGGLRFIAYNVENWLTMDRFVNHRTLKDSPKPDSEKKAVIRILAKHQPDVLGLCEIGTAEDLAEIQQSLKSAGLDLPHVHFTGGSDPVRHLGLLSRFPFTSTSKPAQTDFQLKGRTFSINRGILDASLHANGKPYRFLGVHLKSKREIEDADQEEMRIHEARLLRRHVDDVLQSGTDTRLIVYGDFNDTRPSRTFKIVTGSYNAPNYLTAIPVKDSRGEAWTHHWALHDIYSRIDFVTVTRALRAEVDFRASYIIDDAGWEKASDHRPLVVIFK